MSQRSVEQMVGRLATDEGFRRRFLDGAACEKFAGRLDPRIQKMSLKRRSM